MGKKKQMTASLGRMLIKDTKRKHSNHERNASKHNNNDDDNDSIEFTQPIDETLIEQQLPLKQLSPTIPTIVAATTTTTTTISTTCLVNDDNNDDVNNDLKSDSRTQFDVEKIIDIKEDLVVDAFDDAFFNPKLSTSHVKGIHGIKADNSEQPVGRPPKKHNNRNKREKLRRVYAYLDK